MLFKSLKNTVDTIVGDLKKVAIEAIDDTLPDIADKNREQLEKGLDSEGQIFSYYASENYARFKKAIGSIAPLGVTDLKLTGDFHSGIYAERAGDDLSMFSRDSKAGMLADKYGDNIFGLTDENKADITNNYIFPIITDWLNSQIRRI